MSEPISILVPAYKGRWFKDALASIFAQTYRNFELVVLDDCSPDGLLPILQDACRGALISSEGGYSGDVDGIHVRYYRNAVNVGGKNLVQEWMNVLEYARYDWCVVASDDDIYHHDFLSEMVKLMLRYPGVNLFHCRCASFDDNGRMIIDPDRQEFESGYQFAYDVFRLGLPQALPEFMFRNSALNAIGGFVDLPCAWGSDDATWVKLAFCGGVAFSPRVLYKFRKSGFNITCRKDNYIQKINARLAMYKIMGRFFDSQCPQDSNEQLMLAESKIGLKYYYTFDHIRSLANDLPPTDWLKLLFTSMPLSLKLRVCLDRIRRFWI